MAFFQHRKLLNQSVEDPTPALFCKPYCDVTQNPYGICPSTCMDFCSYICKISSIEISPPPPPPPSATDYAAYTDPHKKHEGLSIFLTVSISILATIFFLLTCYTIYKLISSWYNSRRRRFGDELEEDELSPNDFIDEDQGPEIDHPIWYIRTIGLQPSIVSAITVVKYKKGDGLVEGTDCSVCLNEFGENETLRLLPKCNHAFHIPCIDTWLRSHTNCPMCRAGIVSNAAILPLQEVVVENSEDNRVGESERRGEVVTVSELGIGGSELRIGIDEVNESLREEGGKIRRMKRSVSVDFLSVSVANTGVSNDYRVESDRDSDDQLTKVKESNERSGLTGPSYVKRSLSCSAKV